MYETKLKLSLKTHNVFDINKICNTALRAA